MLLPQQRQKVSADGVRPGDVNNHLIDVGITLVRLSASISPELRVRPSSNYPRMLPI